MCWWLFLGAQRGHYALYQLPRLVLWKLDPGTGSVVQTLTSGVTQPVSGLTYANGYLSAHSKGTTVTNTYLLWKLDPTSGNVVQTLTSGVTAPISGLTYQDVPPSAPTATAATGVTITRLNANWNSASGATGYRLDVSLDSGFSSFINGYQDL